VALAETCRPEAGEPARDAAAFTVDQQTFAVVLPPTAKPIVDCTSVTDHGPYSGPMPP
jgi:hypothetical protein